MAGGVDIDGEELITGISTCVLEEIKGEGAVYERTETSTSTKGLERTNSQGPEWESGRCSGRSKKFGAST